MAFSLRTGESPKMASPKIVHTQNTPGKETHMKLSSPEFANDGFIPEKFTCDGKNINPVLVIEEIPPHTKSLTLIMDDHDSPRGMWVHWVLYNIPVIPRIEMNSAPGTHGLNDFGDLSYGGPCPRTGAHHYHFAVYALDRELNLEEGLRKEEVEFAMIGHILTSAVLVGQYQNRVEREASTLAPLREH